MNSDQQNLSYSLDSLYCEEERSWGYEETPGNGYEDKESRHLAELSENGFFLGEDDEDLNSLLGKEHGNELMYNGLKENPSLASARDEAVDWMLKVVGFHSFSSLTAILAVDYLDRFLYRFQFQSEKPWMSQLVAVTCLSLAAKVEETDAPLLLDLQVQDSKYLFEPKTIQRMELLVLSTLQWKMNPVTPLSFLGSIARRLRLEGNLCVEFTKRCESLLLSLVHDCRYMCHKPSALATATMLYVLSTLNPYIGLENRDELLGILGISKIEVEDCCKLIEDVATSHRYRYSGNKRKLGSSSSSSMAIPSSPKGVVGVCFSSDDDSSSNDSWALASDVIIAASVTSSPEPMWKKIKVVSYELPSEKPAIF